MRETRTLEKTQEYRPPKIRLLPIHEAVETTPAGSFTLRCAPRSAHHVVEMMMTYKTATKRKSDVTCRYCLGERGGG